MVVDLLLDIGRGNTPPDALMVFLDILEYGIPVVLFFLYIKAKNAIKDRCVVKTEATLIDVIVKTIEDRVYVYPIYRYYFEDEEYTVTAPRAASRNSIRHDIGKKFTIHINPKDRNEWYTECVSSFNNGIINVSRLVNIIICVIAIVLAIHVFKNFIIAFSGTWHY